MYSALKYDVMKAYFKRVSDRKIHNGYITLEKKCYYVIKTNFKIRQKSRSTQNIA